MMTSSTMAAAGTATHAHHAHHPASLTFVDAAREICQQARTVLTSLRGGPPMVARGDLANGLILLRQRLQQVHDVEEEVVVEVAAAEQQEHAHAAIDDNKHETRSFAEEPTMTSATTMQQPSSSLSSSFDPARPFLQIVMDPRASGPHTLVTLRALYRLLETRALFYFAAATSSNTTSNSNSLLETILQGVLSCKFEQTDAGADEAVEMAIADVLCLIVVLSTSSTPSSSPTAACSTTTTTTTSSNIIRGTTLMDAFNTVFVTRNTFVHSPALCYHFEDVLTTMVTAVMQQQPQQSQEETNTTKRDDDGAKDSDDNAVENKQQQQQKEPNNAKQLVLDFLVNQLLHTPLVGGEGLDEAGREAQAAHDATRVLALRLTRTALSTYYGNKSATIDEDEVDNDPCLHIVQDGLCLSLLMTGQAIWAYHDPHTNISPGFVSLEVLSEICLTISLLWNTLCLRRHLRSQFETIWTGLYTRALVLLRKRLPATTSVSFNANLIFDAEVEIILESLVDILCLHNHNHSVLDGDDGGALETMFCYYDCHERRSDVASGLMVELCRCCGGTVNEEGTIVVTPSSSSLNDSLNNINMNTTTTTTVVDNTTAATNILPDDVDTASTSGATPGERNSAEVSPTAGTAAAGTATAATSGGALNRALSDSALVMVEVEHPWRQVPAHLKELCAQAVMGAMKCVFRDDSASAETMLERSHRKRSIMLRQVVDVDGILLEGGGQEEEKEEQAEESNDEGGRDLGGPDNKSRHLRNIKSRKRLMRKAARVFNKKSSRGIEFLLDAGLIPDLVTPEHVAAFLRTGIVVGLDKKAVGQYLGEAGKAPVAGKSPPSWERDWFHKDVLQIYCSLFRFENQSLLDGLRMFLACFRLPGEAQQIDRILQAFADSCSQVCEESAKGRLKLFSDDPKKASDAAYLLSFSIIMLNTDRHNDNIREDRKMSGEDFVKNNTDYGRDITEKGKELPPEYLEGIYQSISEEEIRTEGEGADGAMTVERWKDVLRGSTSESPSDRELHPSRHDVEDLTELVLEHVWKPIMSAIGAFWGVRIDEEDPSAEGAHSGMLDVQGARLGMDMSLEMLKGVRQLGRVDIFRRIFSWVCDYTGLLGEYTTDAVDRTWALTNSVEAQSAVVVALTTAMEAGEDLDEDGWKRVWAIIMELRDLKLIPLHSAGVGSSLLIETEEDFLSEQARREWTTCLMKGDMNFDSSGLGKNKDSKVGSVLGVFGRALFGGDTTIDDETYRSEDDQLNGTERSSHGKEVLVVWDECGLSDVEFEDTTEAEDMGEDSEAMSPGEQFEARMIRESLDMSRKMDMPVTGLERVEDTRRYEVSPRARVRERFRSAINLKALVSDSRFMNDEGILTVMQSLADLIMSADRPPLQGPPSLPARRRFERSGSDFSTSTGSNHGLSGGHLQMPISPASEAFAEIVLCEIALKNKDRLKMLWAEVLQDHYFGRLTSILVSRADSTGSGKIPVDPGLEKRVTGLLRVTLCAIQREEIANEVLASWKYLLPMTEEQHASSPLRVLDKHFGEGLWRIVSHVDSLRNLNSEGWEGLVSLLNWCAKRGGMLSPIRYREIKGRPTLGEDDPVLQSYRSLHLLLHTGELDGKVPCSVAESLRVLVLAGESRNYSQLSIASLDLLDLLLEKKLASFSAENSSDEEAVDGFWSQCWRRIVEGMAEAAERSSDSNVRQHALSMLTDMFLDKKGNLVPTGHLCGVLSEVCVPLAGRCILRLQMGDVRVATTDELMIEFELCIGLIFKPLRHHLQNVQATENGLISIWNSVLKVLEDLLRDDVKGTSQETRQKVIPENLSATMRNLANEHFQNSIMVLISAGVLLADAKSPDDISTLTLDSAKRMGISDESLQQWKEAASQKQ